jgi:hypothetical protein
MLHEYMSILDTQSSLSMCLSISSNPITPVALLPPIKIAELAPWVAGVIPSPLPPPPVDPVTPGSADPPLGGRSGK